MNEKRTFSTSLFEVTGAYSMTLRHFIRVFTVHFLAPTQILNQANDWKFLLDEEHNQIVFPSQIIETAKRPDIIIYSESTKKVILIELTVQIEKNLTDANLRKKCKYSDTF